MENEEINKKENSAEKNYYWQSFVISTALFTVFILVLVALGVYSDDNTGLGFILYLLLFYLVNIVLKKIVKKHGEDLLR